MPTQPSPSKLQPIKRTSAGCWPGIFAVALALFLTTISSLDQELWFEIGPGFRGVMKVKVTGSSYVQQLARHAASEALSEPASIGTTNDYADRLYQDGYVKLDISTTDTNSV